MKLISINNWTYLCQHIEATDNREKRQKCGREMFYKIYDRDNAFFFFEVNRNLYFPAPFLWLYDVSWPIKVRWKLYAPILEWSNKLSNFLVLLNPFSSAYHCWIGEVCAFLSCLALNSGSGTFQHLYNLLWLISSSVKMELSLHYGSGKGWFK